ncbi:MAG: ABC transporter ATP-binding protein [Deltaproteobacteria bacterium]|nr:ABC transporter ATP-binding protein [Deltaproteobacteria bacterium]
MLQAINLVFDYNGARVLESVGASVEKGCILSIVGPNGVGKTTLLKCIAGILRPAGGSVLIEDRDTFGMPRKELAKHLGYVAQNMPVRFSMTVFDTVLAGRRPYLAWRPSRKDLERTAKIIEEMNLADLAMRDMDRLSGGQAQKVLLARALAQDTRYLLLDEPTSSLDLRHQLEMLEVIATLVKSKGIGAMMAMHDLNLAARFSDTIMMLHRGRMFCSGTPSEVMTPENIREVYGVEADVRRENGHLHIQPLRCAERSNATIIEL